MFQKDIALAQSKGLERVPIVVITDFTFACGEVHTLLLVGKENIMKKFYKSLKIDPTRKKQKDFSIGTCIIEKEDGSTAIKIEMTGFGKPSLVKKNSKKLMKRLGVTLKDVVKGTFVDEAVNGAPAPSLETTKETEEIKEEGNTANDNESIGQVVKAFQEANKAMNTEVVLLFKQAEQETVVYTTEHIAIAERAFKTAASLVNKYEEVAPTLKSGKAATMVKTMVETIVNKQLVKKYEAIWRKVKKACENQSNTFSEALQMKFNELDQLLATLEKELEQDDTNV